MSAGNIKRNYGSDEVIHSAHIQPSSLMEAKPMSNNVGVKVQDLLQTLNYSAGGKFLHKFDLVDFVPNKSADAESDVANKSADAKGDVAEFLNKLDEEELSGLLSFLTFLKLLNFNGGNREKVNSGEMDNLMEMAPQGFRTLYGDECGKTETNTWTTKCRRKLNIKTSFDKWMYEQLLSDWQKAVASQDQRQINSLAGSINKLVAGNAGLEQKWKDEAIKHYIGLEQIWGRYYATSIRIEELFGGEKEFLEAVVEQLISEHQVCVTGLQKLQPLNDEGTDNKLETTKRAECDEILKKLKQHMSCYTFDFEKAETTIYGSSRATTYVLIVQIRSLLENPNWGPEVIFGWTQKNFDEKIKALQEFILIKHISTHSAEAVQNALGALGIIEKYLDKDNWKMLPLHGLTQVLTFFNASKLYGTKLRRDDGFRELERDTIQNYNAASDWRKLYGTELRQNYFLKMPEGLSTLLDALRKVHVDQLISEHKACVTGLQELQSQNHVDTDKELETTKRAECDGILTKLKQIYGKAQSIRGQTYVLIKQISTHSAEAVQNALGALGIIDKYLDKDNWKMLPVQELQKVLTFFNAEQLISEHKVCVTGLQELQSQNHVGTNEQTRSNIYKKRTECDGILTKLKQNGSSRAKTYVFSVMHAWFDKLDDSQKAFWRLNNMNFLESDTNTAEKIWNAWQQSDGNLLVMIWNPLKEYVDYAVRLDAEELASQKIDSDNYRLGDFLRISKGKGKFDYRNGWVVEKVLQGNEIRIIREDRKPIPGTASPRYRYDIPRRAIQCARKMTDEEQESYEEAIREEIRVQRNKRVSMEAMRMSQPFSLERNWIA